MNLIFILACIYAVEPGYVDQVEEFVSEFKYRTLGAIEIKDRMSYIGATTSSFLELGKPVGDLLAAALQHPFEKDTEEQKALEILYTDFTHEVHELLDDVQTMEGLLNFDGIWTAYDQFVTVPMEDWDILLKKIMDPDVRRQEHKEEFLARCEGPDGPEALLKKTVSIFHDDCPLPSKQQALIYANARQALRGVDARLGEEHDDSRIARYMDVRKRVLTRITAASREDADKVINQINAVATASLVIDLDRLIESSLINRLKDVQKCLLELIHCEFDYIRENIDAMVRILTVQLSKMETISMVCANATSSGSAEKIDRIMADTSQNIKTISSHLLLWINESQENAWPEVFAAAALSALTPGFSIPYEAYNATATLIREEMRKRGNGWKSYQTVVAINDYSDKWSVMNYRPEDYFFIESFRSVHIHLFRYNVMDYERAATATEWLKNNRSMIFDTMMKYIDSSPKDVLQKLQTFVGVVGAEQYRGALILMDKWPVSHFVKINFGIGSHSLLGQQIYDHIDAYKNFASDAYQMNLYLLI